MDGPGPATQANAEARAAREAAERSGRESQNAPFPNRGPGDDGDRFDDESETVYHHQIWEELLRRGSQDGQLRYGMLCLSSLKIQADHVTVNGQPETGTEPLDITAVEESQMTWDMNDRRFFPKNLSLWKRPASWPTPTREIGSLRHNGRIVLDHEGTPIRDFRIPLTISSKVEGLRIESWMRSDDRLTLGDIEARVWTKAGPGGRVPVYNKRALSKRASNARTRAGLISWTERKGRDEQIGFLDNLRTGAQRASNQVLDRDLTTEEKARFALIGLDMQKISQAPTRETRIQKIRRTAGRNAPGAAPSSGAATAGPSNSGAVAGGDDDDGEEAAPETQIRDQASPDDVEDTEAEGSVSSSLIDPSDCRHDEPMNPVEEGHLRDALEDTVEQFVFLTGQEPQPTNPGDNYFSQWSMLQEQFIAVWAANGNEDQAPRLRARDSWIGGISKWQYSDELLMTDDDEPE